MRRKKADPPTAVGGLEGQNTKERMELRIREVDKGGGGLTGTRASEAKGPFPGGKRVGSRGK